MSKLPVRCYLNTGLATVRAHAIMLGADRGFTTCVDTWYGAEARSPGAFRIYEAIRDPALSVPAQ